MFNKENAMFVLAIAIYVSTLLLVLGLFFIDIPTENREPFLLGAGIIFGAFTTVKDFFFGSSQGSKDKSKKLEKREI